MGNTTDITNMSDLELDFFTRCGGRTYESLTIAGIAAWESDDDTRDEMADRYEEIAATTYIRGDVVKRRTDYENRILASQEAIDTESGI